LAAVVLQFEMPDRIALPIVGWSLPQTCWTRRILGLNCPGCGLTRSFVLAADGRATGAWQVHPVGTVVFYGWVALTAARLIEPVFAALRFGPQPNARQAVTLTAATPAAVVFWRRGGPEFFLLIGGLLLAFAWWAWRMVVG
jgi:hypothetical protein